MEIFPEFVRHHMACGSSGTACSPPRACGGITPWALRFLVVEEIDCGNCAARARKRIHASLPTLWAVLPTSIGPAWVCPKR